jgi:retron-type reverse transcriptase
MVRRRLDDRALLHLIRQWLQAGMLDTDGQVVHPETGTPQGGTVSPVLAHVSLH